MAQGNTKRKMTSSPSRVLWLFLLINIIPLTVGGWLLFRYLTGDLPAPDLPAGMQANVALLGGGLLLLFLVASLCLPAAHRAVRGARTQLRYRWAVLVGSWKGNRILSLLALPGLGPFWVLAYMVRLVLIILSLAIIAVILVFAVRLFVPEFAQDLLQEVLSFRP